MRVKKHKHTRKAVQFYKINYGFHDPYKVLLDGNFVHATRESNLADLQTHIPRLLGAKCKMYTTACVMKELRGMGKDFGPTTRAAGNYEIHKCGHTKGESKPAAECIMEQIGAKNNNHWFIATQDMPLRHKLAKIPGCPCVFATVNGLHLEAPPEKARVEVKQSEVRAQLVPAHELASAALEGLEELRPRDRSKSIFRRNFAKLAARWAPVVAELRPPNPCCDSFLGLLIRAWATAAPSPLRTQGPNPLSMKKKKISKPAATRAKEPGQPAASAGPEKGEAGPKKRRVRKKTDAPPAAAE
ncbi:MAG: hypothetical protein WDW36_008144 [Sanguina aurantia]